MIVMIIVFFSQIIVYEVKYCSIIYYFLKLIVINIPFISHLITNIGIKSCFLHSYQIMEKMYVFSDIYY